MESATLSSILVIDDDAALRTLYGALLTRAGFRPDFLIDGQDALERLASVHYDAVILDLMMPHVSGFEILRELAATRPALLRRVVVSSGVSARQLEQLQGMDVFAILRKPFDIGALIATVTACAGQKLIGPAARTVQYERHPA